MIEKKVEVVNPEEQRLKAETDKELTKSKKKVKLQVTMIQALNKRRDKILTEVSEQKELINKLNFEKENT